jgi:hypothetical protein
VNAAQNKVEHLPQIQLPALNSGISRWKKCALPEAVFLCRMGLSTFLCGGRTSTRVTTSGKIRREGRKRDLKPELAEPFARKSPPVIDLVEGIVERGAEIQANHLYKHVTPQPSDVIAITAGA